MVDTMNIADANSPQVLKIADLVTQLREEKSDIFMGINDKQVVNIARLVLQHLARNIDEITEGALKVPGVGSFNVKQIEKKEKSGSASVRRIIFRPAPPKSGKTKA